MAALMASGGILTLVLGQVERDSSPKRTWRLLVLTGFTLAAVALASELGLWRWRVELLDHTLYKWATLGRLLLWFTWPAGALAVWTLWRWRRQWWCLRPSLHLALPLWFVLVALVTTLITSSSDRSLLLALPALAVLAAFALPTLGRSLGALVDWFTLLFFSGSAIVVWVVWLAMQTGVPKQPAANVARLAPGFEPSFSWLPFLIALLATLAWAWLVLWRVGRHRAAIWKSLVLPAGGAALCWLLLMTLWMPLLDYARSNQSLASQVGRYVGATPCLEISSLRADQVAALQVHGPWKIVKAQTQPQCAWRLTNPKATQQHQGNIGVDGLQWALVARLNHPMDKENAMWLFKAASPPP